MDLKLQSILMPVWESDTVFEESAMYLVGNEIVKTLFPPIEILNVTNYIGEELSCGTDYVPWEGGICFLREGNAPRLLMEEMYPVQGDNSFFTKNGGKIAFSEGGFFHQKQVRITYRHAVSDFYKPETIKGSVKNTISKIREGKVRLLFYGDSITCGANASAEIFFYPYQNGYPKLVGQGLQLLNKHAVIEYINTSEGGQTSGWAVKNMEERLFKFSPDLVVLAFGMNDGTWSKDESEFDKNIREIVSQVQVRLPETDIILVSSIIPNTEPYMQLQDGTLKRFYGIQEKYPAILRKIAQENNLSFVNMTSFHQKLLQKKRYYEITGNNVNHPNDFLHRCYAQAILSLFR